MRQVEQLHIVHDLIVHFIVNLSVYVRLDVDPNTYLMMAMIVDCLFTLLTV